MVYPYAPSKENSKPAKLIDIAEIRWFFVDTWLGYR
jgi:hypothetical protein